MSEWTCAAVRQALLSRAEIALLDVREEDPFAQEHPLWAANLPLSRLELEAWRRIPRLDTDVVLYGEQDGGDLAPLAAERLAALGYTRVHRLAGGLPAWKDAGGEVFRDVNVPSKAFGELVEARCHTPSLSADEVRALLDARDRGEADVVVLDARRFDEYQTMNIPGSVSVPGAELVLRARALAPSPSTRIIVNCAGRTRSIIGTQSLVNAGLPNPIAALRNGTIGWTLAGQALERGAQRRFGPVDESVRAQARADARAVAQRAGVPRITPRELALRVEPGRTLYRFDVRTPEEYLAGHLPGFASAPGGQLVQETDHCCPVRGARIVLADDDGVRADMTASWLAQMGWDVAVLEPQDPSAFHARGAEPARQPPAPEVPRVDVATLRAWLTADAEPTWVIDVAPGMRYARGHIPGAWFAIRAQLESALARMEGAHAQAPRRCVVTGAEPPLMALAARDLAALRPGVAVHVLDGGTDAWAAAGHPLEPGDTRLANPRTDRYRRPYEGTDNAHTAMQAYLDWEFGLVEQLGRDGTHFFEVLAT
jgi:rhodanese-related sulfurtransferase